MQRKQLRCFDRSAPTLLVCALVLCAVLVPQFACGQSGTSNPFGGQGGQGGNLAPEAPPPPRMPVYGPAEKIPLLDVKLLGNDQVSEGQIRSMLQSRSGRVYDPQQVEKDVRTLIGSGLFRDVKTYKKEVPGGVIVSFELFERPLIQHVHFVGNEKVKDKDLHSAVGLKVGGPLNRYTVEEGRRRLQDVYKEKGFNDAQVTIVEGTDSSHRGVAYQINEGTVVRIQKTTFVGNTIASSARLKTQIDSKPGILYYMGGKLNKDTLDQDVERLTSYYRSLGFFGARVGRELEINSAGTWARVEFVIDEGPRYRIRNIKFVGNETYEEPFLRSRCQIKPGDYYDVAMLRGDLKMLRDMYGSKGYITSNIEAKPSFLEEPGQLDLVYQMDEGQQFRVGRIIVNIDGEYAHTRRSVVLNRLSIRPGDIVDIRELRSSERRLQASQLFLHDPAQGVTPKIVVKAPDLDGTQMAGGGTQIRGQSPDQHTTYRPQVDLHVNATWNPDANQPPAEPSK